MKLINTIIKDAKPGIYVSKPVRNKHDVEYYVPRLYDKASKLIYYCYDNGTIELCGIGESEEYESVMYEKGLEIIDVHHIITFKDTLCCLNMWLIDVPVFEVVEDIDSNKWDIDKKEFSTWFNELIDYLRAWENHEAPVPFQGLGFLYHKFVSDVDGLTYYDIDAVVTDKFHKEIEVE